jgi:hypothetical protein
VPCRAVGGQRLGKHILFDNEYAGNNRITSVAIQRAVNTTMEEEVFSAWFAYEYMHCGATDVFSMAPSQDYTIGKEQNQVSRSRRRE